MIRKANENDFEEIYQIINDASIAYKGIIPDDRWHEPYMTKEELKEQIKDGVIFTCYIENNKTVKLVDINIKEAINVSSVY
jgi:hypothetical protein